MQLNSGGRFGGRVAVLVLLLAVFLPGVALADLGEEQKLTASGGASTALSDDGSVAVVGDVTGNSGAGAAYVYTRSGTVWSLVATLTAGGTAASGDQFGASVSISGDGDSANIAVGAPGTNTGAGRIHVFTGSGATWNENGWDFSSPLTSAGALGASVSIQGFRIAAGAPNTTAGKGANAGVAIVWDSTDGGTTFSRSTFRANGGQARVGAHFGTSVSLSGNTVLVGSPNYTTGQKNSGMVFVFVNNGGTYTQQTNIRPANTKDNLAGTSVSLFSNTAAFGAPGNSNNAGAVYVYTRTGTTWTQQAAISDPGNTAGDGFGSSVSQLGAFLVAGAPGSNSGNGAAYEFGNSGGSYTLVNGLVPTDYANLSGAQYGAATGVNAGRAIVGAPGDGSAYIFKFLNPSVTTITCFSSDPLTCVPQEPSLTGVAYYVFVHVDGGLLGTPSGIVGLDDSAGGTCTATLDGSGNGVCSMTSTFFGTLTMTASYNGDFNFSPSQGTLDHSISGNHLVFNPTPPADIPQGTQFAGTVEVHNGADALVTTDSATQVTVTITDSCGDPNVIGQVTVVGGIATFSNMGTRFYTLTSGLDISAASNNAVSGTSSNVNVGVNDDFIFADGFEDCRP